MTKKKPTIEVKSSPDEEIFLRAFSGEYVQVISGIGDEPITVNGFLLHKDATYVYLGASLEKIDAVVRCDSIVLIQIDGDNGVHPILAEMELPEDDSDVQ